MAPPIAAIAVSVAALLTEFATEHDPDMLLIKQMNIVSLLVSTIGFLLTDMLEDQLLYTVFSLAVIAVPLAASTSRTNAQKRALYTHIAAFVRLFLWTIGAFYALIYRDEIVGAVVITVAICLNLAVLAMQQAKENAEKRRQIPA